VGVTRIGEAQDRALPPVSQNPLKLSSPHIERSSLLGVVGMPVIHGRDIGLSVIEDLGDPPSA
jgi:hypothetical protein